MSTKETSLRDDLVLQPRFTGLWHAGVRLLRSERPVFALVRAAGTQLVIIAMNIATGAITARLLGAEGRGVYAAVTLWPPLLATLAVAGLNSAVVFRMRKYPAAAPNIAGASLLLGSVHALAAIAVGIVLLPIFMAKYAPAVVVFAQFCLIGALVSSIQILVKQMFAGIGRYVSCNLTHLLPQLFHLLALLLIIPFAAMTPRTAVLALLVSGGVAVLVMLPKFVADMRPRLSGGLGELRCLLSYSARAAPTDIVLTLATYSDRLVLVPLLSAAELGFYAVAFSFSRVVQFIQPAIMSVFFSHMSGQTEEDAKRLHDCAYGILVVCLAAGCLALWSIGKPLLVFMYGAEFGNAADIFRLLVLEASLAAVSQVTMQLFLSRNRPGVVSSIQVVVLCFSVGSLLMLAPRYGAIGAALSLLLAGVIRWLLLLAALKVTLKLPLPRLYPNRADLQNVLRRLR